LLLDVVAAALWAGYLGSFVIREGHELGERLLAVLAEVFVLRHWSNWGFFRRRSGFFREGDQQFCDSDQGSERSDAGEVIVAEVIGIVKLTA
jgi:hypothetical protein